MSDPGDQLDRSGPCGFIWIICPKTREACNCPSGRLVLFDNTTGKAIKPDLEKSIVVIEYPPHGEHGPLWARSGIPVVSPDGTPY
ncbi:MAG: hypothetical protein WC295_00245 [Methanoregula sp.]|jgi:hypothetical protein